ncbi:MAG: rhamnose ABC transporter substrate-binding protein [Clostridiales Family XIII bacterium]|jgi:rhamnose transport system substrate-binding protein|nr:rhamnose ABC transporter substrate-binding protein [Clostridiales Family XIII bacterium]
MRKILLCLTAVLFVAVLLAACSGGGGGGEVDDSARPEAEDDGIVRIYFIPKNLGNSYFQALSSGFYDAISELGEENFEYVYTGPETAEATSQLEYVREATRKGADAIFIAANSNEALNDAFDEARAAGVRVYVINQDIPGGEAHRDAAIMPVNFDTVGAAQLALMAEQIGHKGRFAILSATADAPDQNFWIASMKEELANNPAYARMELVALVYGDDQAEKSAAEMEALLAEYPDLNGVVAPTTVGITAACRVVQSAGVVGKVKVTGLGLPSEMAEFVKAGVCESFQLWNPPYEGYIGAYMAWAEANGTFSPEPGATFSAGKLGDYTVLPNGQILTLETPMLYDASNIDMYSVLF